jgi:hypothetical protein
VRRAIAALLALSAGCALFEDRPDRSCKVSSDCLQAQGETCDIDTKTCVQRPDAQLVSTSITVAPGATP